MNNNSFFDPLINFLTHLSLTEFSLLISGLGLIIGSFLNVVIYRMPIIMYRDWLLSSAYFHNEKILDENKSIFEFIFPKSNKYISDDEIDKISNENKFNLSYPASHCPVCNHEVKWFENIPVLSYLIQKGKCNHCGVKISVKYPIIELMSGILSGIVAYKFGVSLKTLMSLLFIWILIPLSFIDIKHKLLPDELTLLLLWIGLIFNCFHVFTDAQSSIFGAVAGYGSLFIIYWTYKLVTQKEGMGYGDFKLLSALGACFGWEALPSLILISSITALLIHLPLTILKKTKREEQFPFGPYLSLAGIVWLLQLV